MLTAVSSPLSREGSDSVWTQNARWRAFRVLYKECCAWLRMRACDSLRVQSFWVPRSRATSEDRQRNETRDHNSYCDPNPSRNRRRDIVSGLVVIPLLALCNLTGNDRSANLCDQRHRRHSVSCDRQSGIRPKRPFISESRTAPFSINAYVSSSSKCSE
jgi:hypothetical protein